MLIDVSELCGTDEKPAPPHPSPPVVLRIFDGDTFILPENVAINALPEHARTIGNLRSLFQIPCELRDCSDDEIAHGLIR